MKIAICIFLVVSTFAVYSQVQDHEFLNLDDPVYVTENLNLKDGLTREGVIWAFTTLHDGNWFPVTWMSHMLDYQLFGLNPQGHHLTSLLFHIASALILFIVLLRITGALWQSGLVAALFALHPFNIESVAWIAERKNVLSTFFLMLTLLAYSHYVRKPEVKRYLLVALLFALGLMSKSMLVTLPFALLLLDYWPLGRLKYGNKNEPVKIENHVTLYRLILEKLPLLVFSAGSSFTTFIAQKSGGALQSQDLLPLQARIVNALVSYLKYLKMTVWPKGLAILYPHPGNTLSIWKGVVCGVVLVCITFAVIQRVQRMPYLAVGWFWYLGTLVPVIGLVQVGYAAMADRYMYVPLIGIFIIIAWGLPDLMEKWRHRDKVLIVLAGVCIPTLMALTWNQVSHWKSSITIFEHAIQVTDKKYPNFAPVHDNLGVALYKKQKAEKAISQFKMAIELEPNYALPHNNLGAALFKKQMTEEAIAHYKMAIKLKPKFAKAHNNLGNALLTMLETERAIFHYRRAIKLKPEYAIAHYNLGIALSKKQMTEEAIAHYRAAIKLKPDLALAHNNLKAALHQLRR